MIKDLINYLRSRIPFLWMTADIRDMVRQMEREEERRLRLGLEE